MRNTGRALRRRAGQEVVDTAHESVGVERLRHDIADAEAREGLLGSVGCGGEEKNGHVDR